MKRKADAADEPGDAVARFRADLIRALGRAPTGPVALGVSGGPDSMAMLALAHGAFPGAVIAATVDHGLRAEAADEALMVADQCATLGIVHATLVPQTPPEGASLQAQARGIRYALLLDWARRAGAGCLVTAHHTDDQAETFLMRAARGSGVAGLAGVRARREADGVVIVRPLLGWRRAELRAVARRQRMPFIDDPANDDLRHDRTRFRRLLDANEWLDPPGLAQAAQNVAEIDSDLKAMVDLLWRQRSTDTDIDMADLPREFRRRLARRAIGEARTAFGVDTPDWSDAANVEPLLDSLAAGRSATQAGIQVTRRGTVWRFRQAPPRRAL
ncbi:tRNA(Ile)-lysidine synthase [Sphingomonas sp. EC-HK361]|uniref:tRNA lysidine(34) synthetase TilS n=1 Tax=Sphingomonas sp. EC-HK361 TaxID=2038397 RepID=UPI001258D444|nr:tRNA lysidine(34) synthetase TilS [Sphingomonas sp. EC-HK361]VVT22151.1 tRNA(Ile)-lysidine synthase [Sphingomonas sp. EC-HK361]